MNRQGKNSLPFLPAPPDETPPSPQERVSALPRKPRPRSIDSRIDYFVMFATTPAPTVRPPSRIAKRRPWSMAIGAMSRHPGLTQSPGITISVPSGSTTSPVTSVVRK